MWCTRWFLPLLLLPIPTAPPYFLLLFLFSLTMHAKPCFYCIVLLTTLFVSSCYWQPFPLDSSLSIPWAGNITTFAGALKSSIAPGYLQPLPSVMHAVDRCWCDLTAGSLFEPFNVSRWEHLSVQRLKDDLERKQLEEDTLVASEVPTIVPELWSLTGTEMPAPSPTAVRHPKTLREGAASIWSMLRTNSPFGNASTATSPPDGSISPPFTSAGVPQPTVITSVPDVKQPLIRKEYDLRPYGLGILVDFGWTR